MDIKTIGLLNFFGRGNMKKNILAWLIVILAMPALLLSAICMVVVMVVFSLLAIPFVTIKAIQYLINGEDYGRPKI